MSIEKHQQEISLIEVADDGCVDFSREVDDSLNSKTKDRKLGVDILVRDYLISRGYKQAAETLDKERNPQLNQLDNRRFLVLVLLIKNASNCDINYCLFPFLVPRTRLKRVHIEVTQNSKIFYHCYIYI